MTVWSIADVTRDRERQENVFQELQYAIDYLDHAPAGFFSVDAAGDIVYLNATLASWLDHDLAQVGTGSLKLGDIVAGEGAALLTTFNAAPGVKTEVLDLDLKTRGGKPVRATITTQIVDPVGGVHAVEFGDTHRFVTNRLFRGVFRDFIRFPRETRGRRLTVRGRRPRPKRKSLTRRLSTKERSKW